MQSEKRSTILPYYLDNSRRATTGIFRRFLERIQPAGMETMAVDGRDGTL